MAISEVSPTEFSTGREQTDGAGPRRKSDSIARILCVDEDVSILESLRQQLDPSYDVTTSLSGADALDRLSTFAPFAVVISGISGNSTDGFNFLAQVRRRFADCVRILLTPNSDIKTAVAALNDAKIFHFLFWPCTQDQLLFTVLQAVEHNRLIVSERVLLDQTLRGVIEALTEVLALTHPVAFGRAARLRRLVSEMAARLKIADPWQVDIAAMFSQLGALSLPTATLEKVHFGHELTREEQKQVREVPLIAARLLGNIPRLETVREILGGAWEERRTNVIENVRIGSQMLRIASAYDTLDAQGLELEVVIATMRSREGRYDPAILNAFVEIRSAGALASDIKDLPLCALKTGMVLVEDLYLNGTTLHASRGYEITRRFIEHAQNWRKGMVKEPIRVIVPSNGENG